MSTYYNDYPKEKGDKNNPYYRCSSCKIHDPSINGVLENHASFCEYRKMKELELAVQSPVRRTDLIRIRDLLLPLLNCRIFHSESMDIDDYATNDLLSAIEELNELIK